MPEYLAPGVFIEEIERGPKPIQGVSTSTAAFVGETARGPVKPTFITNYGDYLRMFGTTFGTGQYMPHVVRSFFDNGGSRCYIARIASEGALPASATLGDFTITAVGPGSAGNRTFVRVGPGTTEVNGNPVGFRLRVWHWESLPEGVEPFDPSEDEESMPRPTLEEDFDDLSLNPSSPEYYDKVVNNGNSALVTIQAADGASLPETEASALEGGEPGDDVTVADYRGAAPNLDEQTGLTALNQDPYREVSIVYAPAAPLDVVTAVITHCRNNRFRFAVVDSPPNQRQATLLDPRSDNDTSYAGYYYPWITLSDPETGARVTVPPGGAVCGIYARSDNSRGVYKAPANEVVAGALDLEFDIDQGTQEVLNPRGVNAIRRFPGRGIRVWGARTLSSDPLWRYVSVRRLFIFIEASIYRSTQWVVFEPNNETLWARVRQTVTLFLRNQWREGALLGEKQEDAFTVAVGRDTMTQNDILNGRLIVEVGIAPTRPAEFVIFRIFQKTQESRN